MDDVFLRKLQQQKNSPKCFFCLFYFKSSTCILLHYQLLFNFTIPFTICLKHVIWVLTSSKTQCIPILLSIQISSLQVWHNFRVTMFVLKYLTLLFNVTSSFTHNYCPPYLMLFYFKIILDLKIPTLFLSFWPFQYFSNNLNLYLQQYFNFILKIFTSITSF